MAGPDWEERRARAEQILEGDPSDRDARRVHLQARVAMGQVEDPPGRMREHLEDHPDDPRGWDLLSAYLMSAGDFPGALAASEEALRLTPDNFILYYNRACAHAKCGHADAALSDLAHAIDCDEELRQFAFADGSFESLEHDARFRQLIRMDE